MSFRVDQSEIREDAVRTDARGFLRVDARPTRVGIFTYRRSDGSSWKEYRPAEEVFRADSLASLDGCAVTIGHPKSGDGRVNPDNWKEVAVGFVPSGGRSDGNLVAAPLLITDKQGISGVSKKTYVELSCGYSCDLEMKPGEFEGERYDAIQRNIVYNHVALLPAGRARGGGSLRVRLDAVDGDVVIDDGEGFGMTLEEALAELETLRARNDSLEAELRTARATPEAPAPDKDKTRVDEDEVAKRVEKGVQLRLDARSVLGADAKLPKSDRDVRIAVIEKLDPSFKADEKTDLYLEVRFDSDVALSKREKTEKLRTRGDSNSPTESPAAKAQREMVERNRNAWKDK